MIFRVPILRAAAAAALMTATLAGCTSKDADAPDEPYAFGAGDEYVALGDSYTAAANTGAFDGNDGCQRSQRNYPHLVAAETGVELVDNSCSAASTLALTQPQVTRVSTRPPQLGSIDESTDLVTFRLGGNDFKLFGRILLCAAEYSPETPGSPCTERDRALGEASAYQRFDDVESNLARGLRRIQLRAPEATIIVVGYPQIIPERGTCDLVPLPSGDYDYAYDIMAGLNNAARAAAATVRTTFVDVESASKGHDICSDEPWVAGATLERPTATPWHPYPEEPEAVAELILAELQ